MKTALMGQWHAGDIEQIPEKGLRFDIPGVERGSVFINADEAHLPIENGDWVIITQAGKFGVDIVKSSVPFTSGYKVINNAGDLLEHVEDLEPYVYRLFYGRVDEGIETPFKDGFSAQVNGFDDGGFFYLRSDEVVQPGSVVEVLKSSRGYVINVQAIDVEGEVNEYSSWHSFMEAALKKVHGIKPYEERSVKGVLAFSITHHNTGTNVHMDKDVVDVPRSDGRVADVYLISEDGAIPAGTAVKVKCIQGRKGKLSVEPIEEQVSMAFGCIQDIVDELRPPLEARNLLDSPQNGARVVHASTDAVDEG